LSVASFPIDDLLIIQSELLATLLNQPKVNNDNVSCMVSLNYFCLVMVSRLHGPSNACLYVILMLGHKGNFTSFVNDNFPFRLILRFSQQ